MSARKFEIEIEVNFNVRRRVLLIYFYFCRRGLAFLEGVIGEDREGLGGNRV